MSNHRTRWLECQQRNIQLKPWIRIDKVEIKIDPEGDGYQVIVKGVNLRPFGLSPIIMVDDETVTDLEFGPEGRQIKGKIKEYPKTRKLIIEMGFASATWQPGTNE